MKVTVCFGNVRVVVPCGNGDLLIGDLTEKAILRYKKAIGKSTDYWVTVHNLKSFNEGGILDADDKLIDVADDREQIIAIYEEQGAPPLPHNGGDGTSASSVGTSSPDIFQGCGDLTMLNSDHKSYLREGGKNDVVITASDLHSGSNLIVRRGSEPALTSIGKSVPNHELDFKPKKATKRWSAIASIDEAKSPRESVTSQETCRIYEDDEEHMPPPLQRVGGNGQESQPEPRGSFNKFARDSARQSLANNAVMYKWLEAQERQQDHYENQVQDVHSRREPLGGTGMTEEEERNNQRNASNDTDVLSPKLEYSFPSIGSSPEERREMGSLVVMKNSGGALGIHVVPDFDKNGRDMGLMIQGIEAGGRIYRDGRLKVHDRIIEINGTSLVDVDFNKAQEVFKQALQTENLELRVIKSEAPPLPKQPPPPLSKSSVPKTDAKLHSKTDHQQKPAPVTLSLTPTKPQVNGQTTNLTSTPSSESSTQPTSPSKKTPPAVPARNPNTVLTSQPKSRIVAPTNTRRIGKKIYIQLKKGPQGLGFSVTTRDNPAGGPAPIYIKNIMPKGAAIDDGRLKPGDRLLEVNDLEMTGQSQTQVVNMLRTMKPGDTVSLVVSRQVLEDEKSSAAVVPRQLQSPVTTNVLQPPERAGDDENITASKNKDILKMNIPLNETGSAGLGVSVKGKTTASAQGMLDLGIFIKSIITGGAASKDGRLRVNDQLLEVNHQSLADKTNTQAMELLRDAMHHEGPTPGFIHLVVARRTPSPSTSIIVPDSPQEFRISRSEPPPGVDYIAGALDLEKLGEGLDLDEDNLSESSDKPRNPALEKVANIRNVSYQRATHESMMNATVDDSVFVGKDVQLPRMQVSSPTIAGRRNDAVMIEDDGNSVKMRPGQGPKARPASTLGFLHPEKPRSTGSMSGAHSNENLNEEDSGAPKPPDWLVQWDKGRDETDLSPEEQESLRNFEREGFGRQSVSEKRKGHVDPRLMEFYQKMKLGKDKGLDDIFYSGENSTSAPLKRAGSAESLLSQTNNHHSATLHDQHCLAEDAGLEDLYQQVSSCQECLRDFLSGLPVYRRPPPYSHVPGRSRNSDYGPALGLKKSSSLESLQTAVQEAGMDEEGNYFKPPNRGMVRGRGCNESFRAAVDRSYDEQGRPMPTVDEESSESGSFSQGPHSQGSSFSTTDPSAASTDPKKASRKKSKKEKPEKDKAGLFKGLGHMFRFGKHRKPEDKPPLPQPQPQGAQKGDSIKSKDSSDSGKLRELDIEASRARQAAQMQAEQDRVQEYYRQLQEQQRHLDQRQQQLDEAHRGRSDAAPRSMSPPPLVPKSRAERIQQLRSDHQRRHQERQGQYPLDAREELYERQLQEMERQRLMELRGNDPRGAPPTRRPEDPYDRPPSRMSQAEPTRYSHYQNYQEIQDQLSRHDHYQRQYHNQQQYMAHQMAARQAHRYPSDTSLHDPRRQQHHDPYTRAGYAVHDPRHDPRNDPRHYPHSYSHTGLPQPAPPVHRAQTPINQVGYVSHHNNRPPQSSLAAHYSAVPPPTTDLYAAHMRHYSEQGGEVHHPRTVYSSDPNYGSLPRRPPREVRDIHDPNGFMSNAAKV